MPPYRSAIGFSHFWMLNHKQRFIKPAAPRMPTLTAFEGGGTNTPLEGHGTGVSPKLAEKRGDFARSGKYD